MKRLPLLTLLIALFAAFTPLSSQVVLIRAGVMDQVELEGEAATKYSEDVRLKIEDKVLSCDIALYVKNKKLLAAGNVVFYPSPAQTITAQEFTYDERHHVAHFSSGVQVKSAGAATAYTALDYNLKNGRVTNTR